MESELKTGNIDNTRAATQLLVRVSLEAVEALNLVQPKDKRIRILALSMLRAVRIAGAALLLDEHDFVEEVLALSRTLAEVVITSCYLQIANDQELAAFCNFDIQKSYKMSAILEEFMEPEGIISEERRDELKAIVAKARTTSKRKDSDPSWSTKSVYKMAEALDKTMAKGTHLFTLVKATTYEFGHPYVHGTYGSFGSVRRWLAEGTFPVDNRRTVQRFQAVGGLYQCLSALCVYVNERFQLQFRQRILDAKVLNEQD
jgi:hypothetical protein